MGVPDQANPREVSEQEFYVMLSDVERSWFRDGWFPTQLAFDFLDEDVKQAERASYFGGKVYEATLPNDTKVLEGVGRVDSKIAAAAAKVPLAMIPLRHLQGVSRVMTFGRKKHGAGNFYLANLRDGAGERYIGGFLRHLELMQNPDTQYTPESLAALDEESGLPHIDHAICGLLMLRAIMTKCGALPADPGIGKEPK